MSISISPYLFSHPEKPEPVEPRVYSAKEIVVQEAPAEVEEKPSPEPEKPAQSAEAPEESTETLEETTETSDEVLYKAPAGGVYWEE